MRDGGMWPFDSLKKGFSEVYDTIRGKKKDSSDDDYKKFMTSPMDIDKEYARITSQSPVGTSSM